MKRFFSLILCILLVLCAVPFAGCSGSPGGSAPDQSELPVLKVLIDVAVGEDTSVPCNEIKAFLNNHAAGCGTEYLVEVEALPTISQPDKRNPAITRTHMELINGGADVFLVRNYTDATGMYPDLKNLFPYPGSALRQNLFLPLDEYIENDEDWEKLLPSVTAIGSLNGSQQLVPLDFGIKATLIDKAKYEPAETFPMSAGQMLTGDDSVLRWAATCDGMSLLGALGNYETEKLTFSEEELLALVREVKKAQESVNQPEMIRELGHLFAITLGPLNEELIRSEEGVQYHMIPAYNRKSGVTAFVRTYAAINRNTEYPDHAYSILKSFFSAEGQRNNVITGFGLPVRTGLGQESDPGAQDWILEEWEYEQLTVLLEQINEVEFVTALTGELEALFQSCASLEDNGQLEEAVHETFARMSAMISES